MPDGITIRDDGQVIHFSVNNDKAETLSTKFAKTRWGQSATINGNKVMEEPEAEKHLDVDEKGTNIACTFFGLQEYGNSR